MEPQPQYLFASFLPVTTKLVIIMDLVITMYKATSKQDNYDVGKQGDSEHPMHALLGHHKVCQIYPANKETLLLIATCSHSETQS